MFQIIGADGAEYGPYSAEDIRKLIYDRRAVAATRARFEGGEWKTLGEFPEFADALATGLALVPVASVPDDSAIHSLRLGDLCGEAWAALKANAGLLIGAHALGTILYWAVMSIPVAGTAVDFVIHGPLYGGLAWLSLKCIRKEPATLGDAFAGFGPQFLPLMLCGMLVPLLSGIGFILLIIPGLYLIVSWAFPLTLIIDRKLPFWEAMELSRKTVGRRWFWFFGLLLFYFALNLCGGLACVVGLLVSLPFGFNIYAAAYNRLFPPGQSIGAMPM